MEDRFINAESSFDGVVGYSVEKLESTQIVIVAFIKENKCIGFKNFRSLFDSGSPSSFIRLSLVPFTYGPFKQTKFYGMGNSRKNSFDNVVCNIKFRDKTVSHSLVVVPDNESVVPILIGKDLSPKSAVH